MAFSIRFPCDFHLLSILASPSSRNTLCGGDVSMIAKNADYGG
jgi:hypothetical protein